MKIMRLDDFKKILIRFGISGIKEAKTQRRIKRIFSDNTIFVGELKDLEEIEKLPSEKD